MNLHDFYAAILEVLEASGLVLAALFPIVNPIGSAAVFQAMVGELDVPFQRRLAKRIAVYSFFLLILSMLCGGKILSFFGIALYSVQIGGGLIVASAGWSLLNKDAHKVSDATANPEEVLAQAFYPYTLPITVGPGSIAVAAHPCRVSAGLRRHLRARLHLLPLCPRRHHHARQIRHHRPHASLVLHPLLYRRADSRQRPPGLHANAALRNQPVGQARETPASLVPWWNAIRHCPRSRSQTELRRVASSPRTAR